MLFHIKTSPVVVDVRPRCDEMQREDCLAGPTGLLEESSRGERIVPTVLHSAAGGGGVIKNDQVGRILNRTDTLECSDLDFFTFLDISTHPRLP